MTNAADHLDQIARSFWEHWKIFYDSQGWTLGPDHGASKMSPYLVHHFDGLDPAGKAYFRQMAALVLHAQNVTTGQAPQLPKQVQARPQKAEADKKLVSKLGSAMKALEAGDLDTAKRKVRTAYRLARGEPLRTKGSSGDSA